MLYNISGKLEGEMRLKKIIMKDHNEPNINHNLRSILIKINSPKDQHIDQNSLSYQSYPHRIILF